MEHLESNKILIPLNHGFRSGHSCESQLLATTDDLFKSAENNIQVVPHHKLLHKLDHYGIKGPLHKWLTSFLTSWKMRVVLDGETSEETEVLSEIPQGTVLGPILFLCHINDLPDCVRSTVRLFADDCLIYRDQNPRRP